MPETAKPMSGKICLVTGATSGIGEATALALAGEGATVIVAGRSAVRCAATVEEIKRLTGNPSVGSLQGDLSVQGEVRELARQFKQRHRRLDVLVNNAGARFAKRLLSADGYEMTFALNHLACFLLTDLLMDPLLKSGHGRIVNVASAAHRNCHGLDFDDLQRERCYDGKEAYAQSKLAVVLFTYELNRRLIGSGATVNAADPGNVISRFCRNNGLISWARHIAGSWRSGTVTGPEEGARTSVYLAASPEVAGISGKYFAGAKEVASSGASYDADAARRLWEISSESVGLKRAKDRS